MDASLPAFPAAAVGTTLRQPIAIHQQKRPFAQQQPEERLTAPCLVRAVSAVVHPITPLIGVDPVCGVTAAENQVSRKAAGQVTCTGGHRGHVLNSTGHGLGQQLPKAAVMGGVSLSFPMRCQGMNATADGEAAVGKGTGCSWKSQKQSLGAPHFSFSKFFVQCNWTIN